jgi:hypothetical protein
MRIIANIIGLVLVAIGGLWILQGANVMAGSMMSGQPQWLYAGIAGVLVGLGLLYWVNIRGRRS